MGTQEFKELFKRYPTNPIITPNIWPYPVATVFNPGATKFNDQILLLVRARDRQSFSHLTLATSQDGKTGWEISQQPTLTALAKENEAKFGLEDPRIVWLEEEEKYIICCTSFFANIPGEPHGISLIATKDFLHFERLGQQLMPPNKNASLFSDKIKGRYALIHRPIVDGTENIWVSFSPDLKHWGDHQLLIASRPRSWDEMRVGLGPPPIKTAEGWLIIYHGVHYIAGSGIYQIGLALLDLDSLQVIRRSPEWVLGPQRDYEKNIVFSCGAVVDDGELLLYYGANDATVCLAQASLNKLLKYLEKCLAI